MDPRILLVTTVRWFATARLATALARESCHVEVLCPRGHPATKVLGRSGIHRYRVFAPLRSLRKAIHEAQPDLVIPCDDLATAHLHHLHGRAPEATAWARAVRALIERSLGAPSSFPIARGRTRLLRLAQTLGIRVPPTAVAGTEEELADWLAVNGCPAVLKSDGSYGGRGVRVVHAPAEALRGWRELTAPPSPAQALKRALANGDLNYVAPCVLRTRPVVNVQGLVRGQDANATVACWEGTVLAAIVVRVLHTWDRHGPASVVKVVENPDVSRAVAQVVGRLGLSGLVGFDFILEEETDHPYLIEMNPRATQIAHLALGSGRDLPGSLHAALSGTALREKPRATEHSVIAFFPQEWLRDPASPFLTTAYHDIPWDQPELIRACVREPTLYKAWSSSKVRFTRALATRPGPAAIGGDQPATLNTSRSDTVRNPTDIAIVGAGPYGLSIAAHLRAAGVAFRIFGSPMRTWCAHMPDGMLLKSDGFASNLSDPSATFTLQRFCEMKGIPYHDTRRPVSLETFRAYGLAFQRNLVPGLEDVNVARIERGADGFRLGLSDGRTAGARRVVLAVGITHFPYVPEGLRGLPARALSHSSAHKNVECLRGRDVAVIGAGASAVDLAVLLHEAGVSTTLIARRSQLRFHEPPLANGSTLWAAMRRPRSPIGPGWRSRLLCDFPGLFYRLPPATRHRIVQSYLGPAPGWPMRERFVGRVRVLSGHTLQSAEMAQDRVRLVLTGSGEPCQLRADHVIAATGYRVDLRRLSFLAPELQAQIRRTDQTPILSRDFESSVPGLYFVGVASMENFGPMMRFACGADWTAHHLARALSRVSA
jgi:thioredoxin reductase